LPALLGRGRWQGWVAGTLVGVALVAPFAASGPAGLSTSLLAFGGSLHYNDSLHALASWAAGPMGARILMLLVWIALAVQTLRRKPTDPLHSCAVLLAGLLLVLPTVHPWYLLIVLPFLCFFPWWGWLALTGTVALTWLPHLEIATTGEWVEWHWLKVIEYLPLFAWLAWKSWTSRRSLGVQP
jgi:hypothetical protein